MLRALRLAVAILAFGIAPAVGQIWLFSRSDEANALLDWFATFSSKEVKAFCDKLVVKYSNLDAFSNENTKALVRSYNILEQDGYIVRDADGFRELGNWEVSYTFTPTEKLWSLAHRREGGCFFYKTSTATNIKIVQEQKHDHYKQVTIIHATWTRNLMPFEKLELAVKGQSTSNERRGRFVLMSDPFTKKYRLVAWDWGDSTGWWSGNKVPNTIAVLSIEGPQALEKMR